MDILHDVLSARLQVGKERYPVGDGLNVVDGELEAARVGDGDKVKDRVG